MRSYNRLMIVFGMLVAFLVAGCDSAGSPGSGMTYEELQQRFAEADENGTPYSFTLDDLDPQARTEFLDFMGIHNPSSASYEGVTITYSSGDDGAARAIGRSTCHGSKFEISHSAMCHRPGYRVKSQRITNYGGCPHRGYSPYRYGYKTIRTCLNPNCVYRNEKRKYYHVAD
jgi:hypothetical protein